jgi:hypothetical protein
MRANCTTENWCKHNILIYQWPGLLQLKKFSSNSYDIQLQSGNYAGKSYTTLVLDVFKNGMIYRGLLPGKNDCQYYLNHIVWGVYCVDRPIRCYSIIIDTTPMICVILAIAHLVIDLNYILTLLLIIQFK